MEVHLGGCNQTMPQWVGHFVGFGDSDFQVPTYPRGGRRAWLYIDSYIPLKYENFFLVAPITFSSLSGID